MKKLLQIDICKNTLSTGKISEDIGTIAINHGWESWKAYSSRMANTIPSTSHLIEVGNNLDVSLHALESRIFDNIGFGFGSTITTKLFIKKIDEIKPDIIQLHDIKGYWLNIRLLFEYLSKIDTPVVWTLHSCWPFTGHCGHFDYIKCEKWKTGCYDCELKREYPKSWLFDRSFKNYSEKKRTFTNIKNLTLIPVSNWLADFVKDSFLNKYPLQVIHNGIDISIFKHMKDLSIRDKYNLGDKIVILGSASSWNNRKGLDDFKILAEQLPSDQQIILVGLNEKQLKELPNNIIGIQKTMNIHEMAQLYSSADLFINPTYEDTFPTVNLEALACGTPVATYRTGGSVEAVDSETGFIVEQGDINGLKHIISIIQQKGKSSYIDACRMRAITLYDKDKCFEQYIKLYENILDDTHK